MKIVRGRTKGEVETTLASDALGSPDIAPFCQLRKSGCLGTVGGGVDKAVPGSKGESCLQHDFKVEPKSS